MDNFQSKLDALPAWASPSDYEYIQRLDGNGLVMPYVGFDEQMGHRYCRAMMDAALARLALAQEVLRRVVNHDFELNGGYPVIDDAEALIKKLEPPCS